MASKASTKQAVRGIMWTYVSYYSGKLLVFLSTIALARLLSKDDFGVAGYALVVISSLNVLSSLGVGQALIYLKKDPKATDTAFWLGLSISFVLFAATWFAAPLVGAFFGDPRAIPVTRALAFSYPISSLSYIHDMILRKKLSFKRKFIPDLSKSLGKGIFAILFALLGYGVWSLIYSQLLGSLIASIAYWIVVPWKPSFYFSRPLAKKLLHFGLNIVAVNSLSVLLNNSDALLIGRFMGAAILGVYTLAFRVPNMLIMQFNALVSKVIFPFYAKMREDAETLKRGFLYTTKYTTLATIPMGIGIAAISSPLVLTLFGEKWAEAIPVMQALALYTTFASLAYNAGDVYKAQGHPEILTRLTLVEGVLLLPALYFAITLRGTVVAVAWARVFVAFIITTLDLSIASRMLDISLRKIFKTIAPAIGAASFMALTITLLLIQIRETAPLTQLILSIFAGGVAYLSILWTFQRPLLLDGYRILRKAVTR
ncbi:MAG: hypothetical protein DRI32_00165 [Chloroflexi bacterium]|nr:MAG: hypothetical protein B5M51_07365 [Anaerolinea sp. 4484_236]RLD07786.1 MAG: hypothetical protein DRI32_00165 [Chloroflexota bacterium]